MSAQPAVPQGYCYIYIFYALHTNHLPTFLKRIAANSVSGNSAHHSSISLVRQPPPSSTMPTHPHLVATFASLTPPPIMPTTHHHHTTTDVAMRHHQSNNQPHRCKATTTGTELPCCSRPRGRQTMDNDKVSPPSPLLFANPRARCHVSDMATGRQMIIIHRPISTQHNTTATRAHHHPPR